MGRIAVLIILVLLGTITNAQHKVTAPAKVYDAFIRKYPCAIKVKWGRDKANYEVSFVYLEQRMAAVFAANGDWRETEIEIPLDSLPSQSRQFAVTKGRIVESSKILKANGQMIYEAEVKRKNLLFDSTGKYLRVEADDETDGQ
jgi:hypothetical protein